MRTIQISQEDLDQVKAILRTHAEISDMRAVESMTLLARLKRDEPDTPLIGNLEDQVEDFETDSINLNRIVTIFQ